MKALLSLIALLAIHTAKANAAVCYIAKEHPTEKMTFDQSVFSDEVTTNRALVLSEDLSSATDINFEKTSYEDWQKINGRIIVFFSPSERNQYAISIARVSMSHKDAALPLLGMSFGKVSKDSVVALLLPQKKLTAGCAVID